MSILNNNIYPTQKQAKKMSDKQKESFDFMNRFADGGLVRQKIDIQQFEFAANYLPTLDGNTLDEQTD